MQPLDQEGKVSVKVISTDETEWSHPEARAEGEEEKKRTKARNQQSEFSLCLHKLAPVLLAAGGEYVGGGGWGTFFPWETWGLLFYIWTRPDDRKWLQFYANDEALTLLILLKVPFPAGKDLQFLISR